ncbi:MAG: hypothetical protein E7680_02465 [Ruminococcaceae bacterium]|nr:hypothetical protein [Oscillospiraceae bacterium]
MNTLELKGVVGYSNCINQTYFILDSFTRASFRLCTGKIYGIISPFGLGSWGLTNCIGGAGNIIEGTILLDGLIATQKELHSLSCFVSASVSISELSEQRTVHQNIEDALQNSGLSYTAQQIKTWFSLSDERFERPISEISGEIRQVSAAVGFARGKEIFCYPWLISNQISQYLLPQTLSFLREQKKIVLFSTDAKQKVSRYCDAIIELSRQHKWKCPMSLK